MGFPAIFLNMLALSIREMKGTCLAVQWLDSGLPLKEHGASPWLRILHATWHGQKKKKIKKMIPFPTTSKRIKYL